MDLRRITPDYAVAPQIEPADMGQLAADGFTTVICNRPDDEVPPDLQTQAMRAAAEAAGLTFVANPVPGSGLTMDAITGQANAIAEADGPVFAYCRSGTRSTFVWALSQAGKLPTNEMISAAGQAGYDLRNLRGQIDALAAR